MVQTPRELTLQSHRRLLLHFHCNFIISIFCNFWKFLKFCFFFNLRWLQTKRPQSNILPRYFSVCHIRYVTYRMWYPFTRYNRFLRIFTEEISKISDFFGIRIVTSPSPGFLKYFSGFPKNYILELPLIFVLVATAGWFNPTALGVDWRLSYSVFNVFNCSKYVKVKNQIFNDSNMSRNRKSLTVNRLGRFFEKFNFWNCRYESKSNCAKRVRSMISLWVRSMSICIILYFQKSMQKGAWHEFQLGEPFLTLQTFQTLINPTFFNDFR